MKLECKKRQKNILIPEIGFLRMKHILGDPEANPPTLPIIPVSTSGWWDGVKHGRYPKPVRHHGVTMWRIEDILKLIEEIESEAAKIDGTAVI